MRATFTLEAAWHVCKFPMKSKTQCKSEKAKHNLAILSGNHNENKVTSQQTVGKIKEDHPPETKTKICYTYTKALGKKRPRSIQATGVFKKQAAMCSI